MRVREGGIFIYARKKEGRSFGVGIGKGRKRKIWDMRYGVRDMRE